MTLSRKSARTLACDGRSYLWAVSVDSGFLTIVVQAGPGAGQKLEAQTSSGWNWGDRRAITPKGVERLIRAALEDGWRPDVQGPPHRMTEVDGLVVLPDC